MQPPIVMKPCPFCGGAPELKVRDDTTGVVMLDPAKRKRMAWVQCVACGGSATAYRSNDLNELQKGASSAWNRRIDLGDSVSLMDDISAAGGTLMAGFREAAKDMFIFVFQTMS